MSEPQGRRTQFSDPNPYDRGTGVDRSGKGVLRVRRVRPDRR